METSEKFVKQLTEEQRERLREILKLHGLHDKRARAHSILLSDQRYSIDRIADIYQIDRQVVSDWLDSWDDRQFEGLGDDPKAYLIHEEGVSQRMPTMVIGDVAGTGYPDNPPPRSEPLILQSLPGGIIRDLPTESSSMDDQNIEQEPEPKARFISRIELGPASPELGQRARAFVNRLIKMNERPPKIITFKDKPGKYTAQDIIEYLDNLPYVLDFSFIDLEHPYFYTANSRLTLFADETRWAIAFEKSGYTPRGDRIELQLNYFGNCLENLKPMPNSDKFYNSQYLSLINGKDLKLNGDVKLRGQYVKIPDTKQGYLKWVPDILIRDYPREIDYRDLARYLAYEYEELCRATDQELRYHIPHDLPRIMVIDEWHHKTYNVYKGDVNGAPPSTYETYRLIAEVLETKDPSRFKPTLSPNNHWINWPYAGSL